MLKIGTFFAQIESGVGCDGIPDLAAAIGTARRYGIECVDISSAEITDGNAALLRAEGMDVASVYGFAPLEFSTDAKYTESLGRMTAQIDMALSVNSRYFMACPTPPKNMTAGDKPHYTEALHALFSEMCAYASDKPIKITVEDFSRNDRGYASFEEIASLLSENPGLGFTYDSGNFTLAGYDELEGARLFAGRTVHAHIKDLVFADADYPCIIERDGKIYKGVRLGDGFVKNSEALKALTDGGFTDGCAVIELSNKVDRFKKTLESVEWLRRAIEFN